MRAILTCLMIAMAWTSSVVPVCPQQPVGTYRTYLGYNKFLTLTSIGEKLMYLGTELVPEEEDEDDEDDKIKWNKYQAMLNSYVHVSLESDCTFSISDSDSKDAWHRMILVLSDHLGQYVGALGRFGKYVPESDTILIGDGVELIKV